MLMKLVYLLPRRSPDHALGTSVNKEGKGPHRAFPSMIREGP